MQHVTFWARFACSRRQQTTERSWSNQDITEHLSITPCNFLTIVNFQKDNINLSNT